MQVRAARRMASTAPTLRPKAIVARMKAEAASIRAVATKPTAVVATNPPATVPTTCRRVPTPRRAPTTHLLALTRSLLSRRAPIRLQHERPRLRLHVAPAVAAAPRVVVVVAEVALPAGVAVAAVHTVE